MKKFLILIDNDKEELDSLISLVEKSCTECDATCIAIYHNADDSDAELINKISKIVSKNVINSDIFVHLVVDACLTEKEHEMSKITDNNQKLSGIDCLKKVCNLLNDLKCRYYLSIMTRFFLKQLPSFPDLIKLKEQENKKFFAVISKPILDDGSVDEGYTTMARYTDILPESLLTKKCTDAFINVLTYPLKKEAE